MRSIATRSFIPAQKKSTLRSAHSPTPAPKFACRLTGAVVLPGHPNGKQFLQEHFDSFSQQAQAKTTFAPGYHIPEELLQSPQEDGWGGAFRRLRDLTVKVVKKSESILNDGAFKSEMSELGEISSAVGHVRKATHGDQNINNSHPFVFQEDGATWSFAHNGMWPQALSNGVKSWLAEEARYLPQGKTDSEHAFMYLIKSVKSQLGTLNSSQAGTDRVVAAVAQGIRNLSGGNFKSVFKDIPANELGVSGRLRLGPSYNFILEDENMMIGYRNGMSLHYGVQLDAQGRPIGYTIDSAPKDTPNMVWVPVQENALVVITKGPNGQSGLKHIPLEDVSPLS